MATQIDDKKKEQANEQSLPVKVKRGRGRPPGKADPRRQQATRVRSLLRELQKKLKAADAKATLTDYIKLVQLESELIQDEPRDIQVGWVDRLEHGLESSEEG